MAQCLYSNCLTLIAVQTIQNVPITRLWSMQTQEPPLRTVSLVQGHKVQHYFHTTAPFSPVFLTFPLQYSATCTSLPPFTCIGHRLLGDCSMLALLRAQRKNRGPVMPGSTGHPPERKRHSLMSQELLVHQMWWQKKSRWIILVL